MTHIDYGGSPEDPRDRNIGPCGNIDDDDDDPPPYTSTPFLYVFDRNGDHFVMENDVMFGKPSSRFSSLEEGIVSHRQGLVRPDLYRIQRPLTTEDGEIKLQIREIEPEKSAISHISLKQMSANHDERLVVLSDFSGCIKAPLSVTTGKASNYRCYDRSGALVSNQLKISSGEVTDGSSESVTLDTNDYLDVVFSTDDPSNAYLLVESWYRDWTMGEIYSQPSEQSIISPYAKFFDQLTGRLGKGAFAVALISLTGLIGLAGSMFRSKQPDFNSKNPLSALTSKVYADTPTRSLEISYQKNGEWVRFEVIEPRYAKPSLSAVKIPEIAMAANGEASLRVRATKLHKVSGLAVTSGIPVKESEYKEVPIKKAFHHRENKDYTDIIKDNSVGSPYVRLYPSDVLTLHFSAAALATEQDSQYLISVSGVYASSSREEQASMGDWVSKLDEEAQQFLKEVYKRPA